MKLELDKTYKHLYKPSAKKVSVVEVPKFKYLMADGKLEGEGILPGDSPQFQALTEALYGFAYTLKFSSKLDKENPIDFKVMALEGLWWSEDGDFDFIHFNNWGYTLLIMQPDHIDEAAFQAAYEQLVKKKGDSDALRSVRLDTWEEGLSIQITHIGPYATETETLALLKNYATENGYEIIGKHHEIYMSDPRRSKPENLKTVLRLPVRKINN